MLNLSLSAIQSALTTLTDLTIASSLRSRGHSQLVLLLASIAVTSCGVRDEQIDQLSAASQNSGSVVSTGNGVAKPPPLSCDNDDMKTWVHENMLDYYLFSNRVEVNPDLSSIASPEQVTTSLRVQPEDDFSYMADESAYSAFFNEGEVFGYGWNFARASNGSWFFSLIEPGSPLDQAGVNRGDQLLSINGNVIDDTFFPGTNEFSSVTYPADTSITIDVEIRNSASNIQTLSVGREQYNLQTVLQSTVLETNGVSVGYLAFYQFLQTSTAELDQAFELFADSGISELVLDLRFNGGGRVDVANELASYIIGTGRSSDIFARFSYNDKYQDNNFSINYIDQVTAPQLNRLFVLQSGNTCSASELVVNSLRAYMEVITVGDTSCGKPYATTPNVACSKVLNALEIDIQNADGAGGYFQGIGADCPVAENVSFELGDEAEPLLAAALGYVNTGSCGGPSSDFTRSFEPANQTLSDSDRPDWQSGNQL